MYFSIATVGGSEFILLLHCCHILWYPMIVTVFLCFFVMTAYALATSPAICCSFCTFVALPCSLLSLSFSTGNSRLLATCAAIEFICPIHCNPSPSAIRIIEFIHLVMVIKAGKSPATEVASTKVAKSSVTSEVASGRVTRSGRNLGLFVSAEASVTKNASGRNAGAFAHGKSAVAKTASLHAHHMEEDISA